MKVLHTIEFPSIFKTTTIEFYIDSYYIIYRPDNGHLIDGEKFPVHLTRMGERATPGLDHGHPSTPLLTYKILFIFDRYIIRPTCPINKI